MKIRYKLCRTLLTAAVFLAAVMPLTGATAQQAVSTGALQYTVTDYGYLPGLQTIAPGEGNQFLSVNLIVKTADETGSAVNPEQYLLALDDSGRGYTPLLFNSSSSFTASLAPDERAVRALFEIPKAAASYKLVITDENGSIAGDISLGRSAGAVLAVSSQEPIVFQAEGYDVTVYGVTQSLGAYGEDMQSGMKYIWIDAAITGTGTQETPAKIISQWTLGSGSSLVENVVPARSSNMLALINAGFGEKMPFARGYVCFLVPDDLTKVSELMAGKILVSQAIPIGGAVKETGYAKPNADGAYQQAGWKITIHDMELADKGTLADPPAGYQYVMVNLTVANQGTQNLTVSSELAFAMTDESGNELAQAWFADLTETLDASLLPSESVSGKIAFLLPEGAKVGALRIHLNMLGEPLLIDAADYLAE